MKCIQECVVKRLVSISLMLFSGVKAPRAFKETISFRFLSRGEWAFEPKSLFKGMLEAIATTEWGQKCDKSEIEPETEPKFGS